jgi:photosystem I subunit 10
VPLLCRAAGWRWAGQTPRALKLKLRPPAARSARVVTRADGGYIGSATNLIMVASTGLVLAAGRFGLAPTANRLASAGARSQLKPT